MQKNCASVLPDAADDKVQTLGIDQLYTFDASHIADHENVVLMENMHEELLLHVLHNVSNVTSLYVYGRHFLLEKTRFIRLEVNERNCYILKSAFS